MKAQDTNPGPGWIDRQIHDKEIYSIKYILKRHIVYIIRKYKNTLVQAVRQILWFMNTFVCEQFSLQTKAFGKNLFLFLNSASGDQPDPSHLSYMNTNTALFSRILGRFNY